MARVKKDSEKIQVTFNKEQIRLIKKYRGIFGEDSAEIVRHIVANWLLDNSMINEEKKK